uniref:Uncharacterized protein n=1 Tax=Ditylenchus dipsaci TaxID=166011 RepID=A0A915E9T7_9BILA
MKKAKENSGVTINSRTNDPSEDDVADDSDKITRIHISSQPESPRDTFKPTNKIQPSHILLDGDYKDHPNPGETEELSGPMSYVAKAQDFVRGSLKNNANLIKKCLLLAILVLYHIFLGFAIAHDFNKASNLLTLTVIVWMIFGYYKVAVPLLADKWKSIAQPTVTDLYTRILNLHRTRKTLNFKLGGIDFMPV